MPSGQRRAHGPYYYDFELKPAELSIVLHVPSRPIH
jgi:hypothetical protein